MIVPGLLRIGQQAGLLGLAWPRRLLLGILPAHHPDRGLRHTGTGQVIRAFRGRDDHARGEVRRRGREKHMRPQALPLPIGAFLHLPARRLLAVRWRPVSPDNIAHLLPALQQEIERRLGRHPHGKGRAWGIGVDLLGGRGFLPGGLRRGRSRVRGRLHQLRDGPRREVFWRGRDGWWGWLLMRTAYQQYQPYEYSNTSHTTSLSRARGLAQLFKSPCPGRAPRDGYVPFLCPPTPHRGGRAVPPGPGDPAPDSARPVSAPGPAGRAA